MIDKQRKAMFAKRFDGLSQKNKVMCMADVFGINPEHVDTTGYKYGYFEPQEKKHVNSYLDALHPIKHLTKK